MKRNLLMLTGLAAIVAVADITGEYNTWQGYHAGNNATGDRATVQGAAAGSGATYIERSEFIGAAAGAFSHDVADSVGLGYRALRSANSLSHVVAIGSGALAASTNLDSVTWINGQFYASESEDAFWIKPSRTASAASAPLSYSAGTLRENVDFKIETTAANKLAFENAVADVWLSAYDGSDANDGLSPTSAVKTIAGAYTAAYNGITNGTFNASNEVVVAVAEGVYAPASIASAITKGIAYVATGDRKATIINGMLSWWLYANTYTNGTAMAFTVNPCRMTGFTLTSFNRMMRSAWDVQGHRMMTHGIRFERCDITGNYTPSNYGWIAGEFVDCDIHGNKVLSSVADTAVGCVFGGYGGYDPERAHLTRCHVWDNDFSVCAELFYSGCSANNCLFEVEFYEGRIPSGGNNTIIAKTLSNPNVTGLSHTRDGQFNTNSFVVVAEPGPGYDESIYNPTGVSCVVSNANLTADFVAADASCPSVRSDGKPDYGYRNSGFGPTATFAQRLGAYLVFEGGELCVYTNGVKAGTATFTPSNEE